MNNPYASYRQNAVSTARPGELTLMLYSGALGFVREAAQHIEQKNMESAHRAILRAQDIVLYLSDTLNTEYEVGQNLALLYDYLYRRLVEANVKKSAEILAEVLELLGGLREAWEQALKTASTAAV